MYSGMIPGPEKRQEKEFLKTRQIIRYRASATLRRLQIKQYTASKEGGGGLLQNQREHHMILTKYEAVLTTAVSEIIPHQRSL